MTIATVLQLGGGGFGALLLLWARLLALTNDNAPSNFTRIHVETSLETVWGCAWLVVDCLGSLGIASFGHCIIIIARFSHQRRYRAVW